MTSGKLYLTEESLAAQLKRLFPAEEFVHDKAAPGTAFRGRPDYRCDRLKLIVEFDGYRHYSNSAVILKDLEKDTAFAAVGYRIIRIPYFVQPSTSIVERLFGLKAVGVEQVYPHGFVAEEALLPADFCHLGIVRFRQDLDRFDFIRDDIIGSLRGKIKRYGDVRLVLPEPLADILL